MKSLKFNLSFIYFTMHCVLNTDRHFECIQCFPELAPVGCRQAGWSGAGFSSAGNAFMQVLVLSVSRLCDSVLVYISGTRKCNEAWHSDGAGAWGGGNGAGNARLQTWHCHPARECRTTQRSLLMLNSFSTFALAACCFLWHCGKQEPGKCCRHDSSKTVRPNSINSSWKF